MSKNILFIFVLILICTTNIFGQNLLVNGNFEEQSICKEFNAPCAIVGWKNVYLLENKYDLFPTVDLNHRNSCRIVSFDYEKKVKTYVQTMLLCPLVEQEDYILEFEFQTNTGNFSEIGLLLSNNYLYEDASPNLINKPDLIINDYLKPKTRKNKWQKVSIKFKAKKSATHIIIGNFQASPVIEKKRNKYIIDNVFIDNISLIRTDGLTCESYEKNKDLIYKDTRRHSFIKKEKPKTPLLNPITNLKPISLDSSLLFVNDNSLSKINEKSVDTLTIFFQNNSVMIDTLKISSFLQKIKAENKPELLINGYANSVGEELHNQTLSQERAKKIAAYIAKKYSFPITINSYGDSKPSISDSLEKDRRAEIIVIYP